MFRRNLPNWERLARAAVAIAVLISVAVAPLSGIVGWIAGLGGASLLISSLIGFCPACALAGRRLP